MDNWINSENMINNMINQLNAFANYASSYNLQFLQEQERIAKIAKGVIPNEAFMLPHTLGYNDAIIQISNSSYYALENMSNTLSSFNIYAIYGANISLLEDKEIDKEDVKLANEKIITEIFLPNDEKRIDTNNSGIIKLSPINDDILHYLAENPQELYNLSGGEFEDVMAKIYSKLGYDVERTKATRDGGKDLIIRKREILGDFVYYVECKKYAADRPIGVGIVKNLACTINEDGVNGGILATTSFFTSDAVKHIKDYKYGYRIQMHDYNYIQNLLKMIK